MNAPAPQLPPHTPRGRTESAKRMSLRKLRAEGELYPERDYWRPRTRADCEQAERPCPFVGCRHHLYIDVSHPRTNTKGDAVSGGAIKFNFPDIEPHEMQESCSLDVAQGAQTLEDVGVMMNVTRERVRQIEAIAIRKLPRKRLEEFVADSDTIIAPEKGSIRCSKCEERFLPSHGNQKRCQGCRGNNGAAPRLCPCGAAVASGKGNPRYGSIACPSRAPVPRVRGGEQRVCQYEQCGKTFQATRSDQRFCPGGACRLAEHVGTKTRPQVPGEPSRFALDPKDSASPEGLLRAGGYSVTAIRVAAGVMLFVEDERAS